MNKSLPTHTIRSRFTQLSFAHMALIVALVLTAWVYFNGLDASFYRDDAAHIKNNSALHHPASLLELFTEASNGMTRYLTVLTYRMAWLAGDGQSWPFHLMSLMIHLLNGCLLYSLLRRSLPESKWLAVFTSAIFLLHPMQVNPVIYASKFAVLLSSFFILLALNVAAYRPRGREPMVATALLTVLAVLSKEIAVFLPLLVLAFRWQVTYGSFSKMGRVVVAKYIVQFLIVGVSAFLLNQVAEQPSYGFHIQPGYEYFLTQMYNGWRYLALLLLITPTSHIHPHPHFTPSIAIHGLGFLLAALIALYFLSKYAKRRDLVLFFVMLAAILLAPTHTFIPKRTAFAEYQFYLPNAAAIFVLLSAGWQLLQKTFFRVMRAGNDRLSLSSKQATLAAFVVLVLALTALSYAEVKKWHDPLDLAVAGFEHYPQDATVSCIMAERASSCGDEEAANKLMLDYYKREHNYYRYTPPQSLNRKFDFLMKHKENAELLRQLYLARNKYGMKADVNYYQYFLYALRANHLRKDYEKHLKAARQAFPGQYFLEFMEQLPVEELLRRNPEYWKKVN